MNLKFVPFKKDLLIQKREGGMEGEREMEGARERERESSIQMATMCETRASLEPRARSFWDSHMDAGAGTAGTQ